MVGDDGPKTGTQGRAPPVLDKEGFRVAEAMLKDTMNYPFVGDASITSGSGGRPSTDIFPLIVSRNSEISPERPPGPVSFYVALSKGTRCCRCMEHHGNASGRRGRGQPRSTIRQRKAEAPARSGYGRLGRDGHERTDTQPKWSNPGNADHSKAWLACRPALNRHPECPDGAPAKEPEAFNAHSPGGGAAA